MDISVYLIRQHYGIVGYSSLDARKCGDLSENAPFTY